MPTSSRESPIQTPLYPLKPLKKLGKSLKFAFAELYLFELLIAEKVFNFIRKAFTLFIILVIGRFVEFLKLFLL